MAQELIRLREAKGAAAPGPGGAASGKSGDTVSLSSKNDKEGVMKNCC